MQQPLEDLRRRVDRLECENRLWRRGGALILLLAGGALLSGQAPAPSVVEEVSAKRFVLRDETGGTRGALTLAPGGTVLFVLADSSRRPRVSLMVDDTGAPSLTLYDQEGHRRVAVGVDEANAAHVLLLNTDDTAAVASLTASSAGMPVLMLSDPSGKPRLVAALANGESTLALSAPDSQAGVMLVADGEAPRLALSDSQGVERLWAAIRKDGPVLQFFDKNRVARSGLATINDEAGVAVMSESTGASFPGLVLFGKGGDILWSAPN